MAGNNNDSGSCIGVIFVFGIIALFFQYWYITVPIIVLIIILAIVASKSQKKAQIEEEKRQVEAEIEKQRRIEQARQEEIQKRIDAERIRREQEEAEKERLLREAEEKKARELHRQKVLAYLGQADGTGKLPYDPFNKAVDTGIQIEEMVAESDDDRVRLKLDKAGVVLKYILRKIYASPELVNKQRVTVFLDQHIPYLDKVLDNYRSLSAVDINREPYVQVRDQFLKVLDNIEPAYQAFYDELYQDKVTDLSTDLSVLDNLLVRDGLKDPLKAVADNQASE